VTIIDIKSNFERRVAKL